VAQEFQRVWAAYQRDTKTAAPQFTFAKAIVTKVTHTSFPTSRAASAAGSRPL
jgi:hypothetical protein